jgi:peroxiredoxin/predicted 2-oxoglutarate/Fe(II)-dependent dioxygenase YbiX
LDYQNKPALDIGDFAPDFVLPDEGGNKVFSRAPAFAGQFLLMMFLPRPEDPAQMAMLRDCAAQAKQAEESGLFVLAVTPHAPRHNARIKRQNRIPFRLLSDSDGAAFLAYGAGGQPRAVLVDANARVIAFPLPHAPMSTALAEIARPQHHTEPVLIAAQAPVLLIPGVLSPQDCKVLIEKWERENVETGVATEQSGVGGQEIDHTYKSRRDHQIDDPAVIARVNDKLARRIVPEVRKAFNYEITRFEHLRIGCYDAGAGYFRAHRDNTKPATAHRKFALTLCLNDDYEGGCLRFPEYGEQFYRPPAGGAVVFSTSLLHEVLDVTAGRRFTLITFFFGETEYAERKARYEAARGATPGQT